MITEQTKHSSFVFIRWHCRYFFRNYSWNKSFNEDILTFYSFCIALTLWFKIGNIQKKRKEKIIREIWKYWGIPLKQFCYIGINSKNFFLLTGKICCDLTTIYMPHECRSKYMNVYNFLCIHQKPLFKSVFISRE